MSDRTREQRLRRKARRQGFELEKCRVRDQYALNFGTYRLVEIEGMWGRTGGDRLAVAKPPKRLEVTAQDEVVETDEPARAGTEHGLGMFDMQTRWRPYYGLTLDEVEAWLTGERGPIEPEGRES